MENSSTKLVIDVALMTFGVVLILLVISWLLDTSAPKTQPPKAERRQAAYNVPALKPGQGKEGWATILSPHSRFEGQIVLGRLQTSGIRARLSDSVIGGWIGKDTVSFVQVRVEDYDKARNLLNSA